MRGNKKPDKHHFGQYVTPRKKIPFFCLRFTNIEKNDDKNTNLFSRKNIRTEW